MFTAFGFSGGGGSFIDKVYSTGGTLTPTEISALETLESDLKTNNIWDGLDFLFPFVGNASGSCGLSMVNTRIYFATFDNNWTFNSSGITGTNAEANTNIPNTLNGTSGDYALGMYIGNNITSSTGLEGGDVFMHPRTSADNYQATFGSTTKTASGITDSTGHYTMVNLQSTATTTLFKNAVSVGGGTETRSPDGSNYSLGWSGAKTYHNFCILYGGPSVTTSNVGTMNTIVNTFITALSR